MTHRTAKTPSHMCARLLSFALTALAGVAPAALAQEESVAKVNETYRGVEAARRSDSVLLPILAKMEPPPAVVASIGEARLLPADAKGFAQAKAWAEGSPQQVVLSALAGVTKEQDWKKSPNFAQVYGAEGVTPDLIRSGMYSELGDPPTLAWVNIGFMPALDRLEALVNVEATRLAAEGRTNDAIEVLVSFTYLGRQICDRQFFSEAQWGLRAMTRTLERIRDVAYTDSRSAKKIDPERLKAQIDRMGERGVLDLSRMKWPQGNRLAADQMVERMYGPDGMVRADVFPTTMARLGTAGKPLRLFSESARWRNAASQQGLGGDAAAKVQLVYGDWERRWSGDYFDARLQGRASEYAGLDKAKYAVVALATPDMGQLIEDRQQAVTEQVGTRLSLALMAQMYVTGMLPPQATAARPRWLKAMEADGYNSARQNGALPPPVYFIPTKRGNPVAHSMDIVTATSRGNANFNLKLKGDIFVLYSVGTDHQDNNADRIENTTRVVQGADYLLWPPVLSLYRQNLVDRGDIE